MKRRRLKKEIHATSSELLMECCVLSFMVPTVDMKKKETLVVKITQMEDDFTHRISHYDGKNSPALVKSFFAQLKQEWGKGIDEIMAEFNSISK